MTKYRVVNVRSDKLYYFDSLSDALLFFYDLCKCKSELCDILYVQYWDDSQDEGEKWVSPEF